MALNGSKDKQVNHETNLDALRSGLTPDSRSRIEAAEGLNHLFQRCTTGEVTEYREIEETISPEILETLVKWLTDTIGNNKT